MVIDESNVIFLQGFLDACSVLTDSDNTKAMTIVTTIPTSNDWNLNFLNFYDFLENDCIVTVTKIMIYDLEKIFFDNLFNKQSIFNKITEDRKSYISYKFMDYLLFCFEETETIVFEKQEIIKIRFKYNEVLGSCFIFPNVKLQQSLMLTFWNDE